MWFRVSINPCGSWCISVPGGFYNFVPVYGLRLLRTLVSMVQRPAVRATIVRPSELPWRPGEKSECVHNRCCWISWTLCVFHVCVQIESLWLYVATTPGDQPVIKILGFCTHTHTSYHIYIYHIWYGTCFERDHVYFQGSTAIQSGLYAFV